MAIDANTGEFIPDFFFGTTEYQSNWPLQQLGTRVSVSVVNIKTGTKPLTPIKISNSANNVNDRTVTSGIINSRFYTSSNNFTDTIVTVTTVNNTPNIKNPSNYIYLKDDSTVYKDSPYIQQNRFSDNVKNFLEVTRPVIVENRIENNKYLERPLESYYTSNTTNQPFAVAAKIDSANGEILACNLVSVVIAGTNFVSRNLPLNNSTYFDSKQKIVITQNTPFSVGTTSREFKSSDVVINTNELNNKFFTKPIFNEYRNPNRPEYSSTRVSVPVEILFGRFRPKTQVFVEVNTTRDLTNLKYINDPNADKLYLNTVRGSKLTTPGKVIIFDASNKNVIGTSFVTGQYTSPGSNITQGGGDYWA